MDVADVYNFIESAEDITLVLAAPSQVRGGKSGLVDAHAALVHMHDQRSEESVFLVEFPGEILAQSGSWSRCDNAKAETYKPTQPLHTIVQIGIILHERLILV